MISRDKRSPIIYSNTNQKFPRKKFVSTGHMKFLVKDKFNWLLHQYHTILNECIWNTQGEWAWKFSSDIAKSEYFYTVDAILTVLLYEYFSHHTMFLLCDNQHMSNDKIFWDKLFCIPPWWLFLCIKVKINLHFKFSGFPWQHATLTVIYGNIL